MARLATRDFVSVDYEQSPYVQGYTILARKRSGSYARFVMDPMAFTAWMQGAEGKHLVSVQELHWGFTGDTEKSLKDELDIETEADREVNRMVREIQDGLVHATERFIGQTVPPSPALSIEQEVRLPLAPSFIPLRFDVSADMGPLRIPDRQFVAPQPAVQIDSNPSTNRLISFRDGMGVEKAYIDSDGNFITVGAQPRPPPPPVPEPVVPPDLSGRIIDLD